VFAGLAITAGAAELALRGGDRLRFSEPLLSVNPRASYQFENHPGHPEISSQGLRDEEYPIPKPENRFRILILGDSVTYGLFVPRERVFSEILEAGFRSRAPRIEVLNAGVNGYTLYNELKLYAERLRRFEPDLVLVGICMNDVVDPVLHWGDEAGWILDLPEEAIPNREFHEKVVLPRVRARKPFWEKLALFRVWLNLRKIFGGPSQGYETAGGKRRPIYVAEEPSVTLKSLMDQTSPESQWLRKMLAEISREVRSDGIPVAFIIFPLSYQLEEDYPYKPQEKWMEYCAQMAVPCLDLLPVFRDDGGEKLFMGRHAGHPRDIWHLSSRGHEVTAGALKNFLIRENLIPVSGEKKHEAVF